MNLFWTEVWLHENSVRNRYETHRALWRLFPERDRRDFLFSLVERRRGAGANILLQSDEPPILPADSQQGLKILRGSKNLQRLSFSNGQQLRFRLVANPTKKIKDQKDADRSIRVPHVGEGHKIAWLERKLAGAAHICNAESCDLEPVYFSKPGHRGKIQPVMFTGVLEIEDGEAFVDMMKKGVGPAKSFGCGLIQVSRI